MMENFESNLDKYAELALRIGINLKEDEGLIISTNEHGLDLARLISNKAYELGAKHVEILFSDDAITLGRFNNAKESVFENFPKGKVDYMVSMYENNYHHLFIIAPNPELLKTIPAAIVAKDQKTLSSAMEPAMNFRMTGKTKWCIVAVPSPEWAGIVFPELSRVEAEAKLWAKIFDATRINENDPVAAWKRHDERLKKYKDYLNEARFEKLLLSAPGTNLEVYLAQDHHWMGGSKVSTSGDPYVANIPTEEVFTTPYNSKVNGTVTATKPLSLNGNIVRNFGFTFQDGKVVDCFADTGKASLDLLLDNDEGARFLGEVALVPFDSPISNTNILFNNTLFDENASVHLALGRAYPYAIKGGTKLTSEELISKGANYSTIHVDFMVGGAQMNIFAFTKEGREVQIFKKGNWCI